VMMLDLTASSNEGVQHGCIWGSGIKCFILFDHYYLVVSPYSSE
jgi:hypothetical protein